MLKMFWHSDLKYSVKLKIKKKITKKLFCYVFTSLVKILGGKFNPPPPKKKTSFFVILYLLNVYLQNQINFSRLI